MEVTESLHRSACHATFALTNNKGYEVQMLCAHVQQEALMQAENYYEWRQHTFLDVNLEDIVDDDVWIDTLDNVTKSDSSTPVYLGLTLAIRCHDFTTLDDVVSTLGLLGLLGSIIHFLESGDTGTNNHSRYLYQSATDSGLPLEAHRLALWWSVGLTMCPLDWFHLPKRVRLYCRYDPMGGGRSSFSTVLVKHTQMQLLQFTICHCKSTHHNLYRSPRPFLGYHIMLLN
jgi:hypothetical protein